MLFFIGIPYGGLRWFKTSSLRNYEEPGAQLLEIQKDTVIWERTMELLAQVPDLLENRVRKEGPYLASLVRDLGSEELLAALAGDCVRSFLSTRKPEELHIAIRRMTDERRWHEALSGLNAVQRSRFRSRLGEEITDHLSAVVFANPDLRNWFLPGIVHSFRMVGD